MMLDTLFQDFYTTTSDIQAHMPMLRYLASQSAEVVEFGVRCGFSTISLLAGCPKRMKSFDVNPFEHYRVLKNLAVDTDFTFHQINDLHIEPQDCDLLFIDTVHTYQQVKAELKLHGKAARKYIALHDTELYGSVGEDGKTGINKAIKWFMNQNKQWSVLAHSILDNGLTVLVRNA